MVSSIIRIEAEYVVTDPAMPNLPDTEDLQDACNDALVEALEDLDLTLDQWKNDCQVSLHPNPERKSPFVRG